MTQPSNISARAVRMDEVGKNKPIYAVWELTLKCDHACAHCGSRAGPSRVVELETEKILEVARSLMELGTREVTLIGGEAYLHKDIFEIIRFLARGGIRVTMQTGGRGLTSEMARDLKKAGLSAVGVSIDGPAEVHDELRAAVGSHAAAMNALRFAREAGLIITSNTQVNRLNAHLLRETGYQLRDAGVRVWRLQLTVPMGRAADRPDWILQPHQILDVMDTMAEMQVEAARDARRKNIPLRKAFGIMASNNIGYFGPHEQILRSRPGGIETHWRGCQAGRYTLGIESDGTIKACPSLPTAPYAGGNVRDLALEEIWENSEVMAFVRERTTEELWGFCKTCYYADVCRAGCSFTAHCTMGRRGNNPFCYYRASTLKKDGIREKLVRVEAPDGLPYDFGRFEVVREPWPQESD